MRMIDFTPSQRKTVAAAITVLAFSLIVVFVLTVGWVVAKFLSLTSAAITPVIVGLFLCSSRITNGSGRNAGTPRCRSC